MSYVLFPKLSNPFRFDEERVLVEELQVLLRNYAAAALPLALLILLLLWALPSANNAQVMQLWGVLAILSTLNFYLFARRHLRAGISLEQARHLAWSCVYLRLLDGVLWGLLIWVAFDTNREAGNILIFASIASMAGGAVSTLSPVFLVYIAYALPLLGLMAINMWLTGDPTYSVIGWAGVLYFFAMLSQAHNTLNAVRSSIKLRFELIESNRMLSEIAQRETLAKERRRLVQDMHDGLGSSLVSALRVAEHGKMGEEEVAEVLRGCIDDLKLAIDSMETVESDLLLLLATLRYRLSPRLVSMGITLKWEVQVVPMLEWLDPRNSLHILRILQEVFTNIIKHTHATEIRVATSAQEDYAVVTITDNGQGFNLETALESGGKGLSNQLRRAEFIGAEVNWFSSATGTCFTLRLPITQLSESMSCSPE
jgi:signal transduction histidine kinase